MASTSLSHLIMFIASILVALSVSGILIGQVLDLSQSSRDSAESFSQDLNDDIRIINDPANVPYNGTHLTLYVKNTGSSSIPVDEQIFNVLIDGSFESKISVSLVQGSGSWSPGEVVKIEVEDSTLGGDHTVKVIARSASDKMNIRIE
ncbi:MAG: flagellar protein G [Halobacteria archaeon]|nr:flagellar protein G [Halobacteria archaeon]